MLIVRDVMLEPSLSFRAGGAAGLGRERITGSLWGAGNTRARHATLLKAIVQCEERSSGMYYVDSWPHTS